MDGGVVELDALADADGAGAEDDDGLAGIVALGDELRSLVLLVIGAVEIGVSALNSAPQVSTILNTAGMWQGRAWPEMRSMTLSG